MGQHIAGQSRRESRGVAPVSAQSIDGYPPDLNNAAPISTQFCPSCGAPASGRFCANCGANCDGFASAPARRSHRQGLIAAGAAVAVALARLVFYRSETKAQTTSPVAEQTQTAAPQATVPTPTATAKKDTGPDGTRFYGVNSNKLGSMVGCPKGQLSGQPIHHAPSNYLPEFQTICILNSFNTVDLAQTHIETFDSWKDEKPQLNIAAHTGGTFQSAAYGPGWIIESQDPTIAGIVVDVLGSGKLVDLP